MDLVFILSIALGLVAQASCLGYTVTGECDNSHMDILSLDLSTILSNPQRKRMNFDATTATMTRTGR